MDSVVVFKKAEDGLSRDRAAPRSSTPAKSARAILRELEPSGHKRRAALALLCNALTNLQKDAGRALARQFSQVGGICCREIMCKTANKQTEFFLADSRMPVIFIICLHNRLSASDADN
jgi:hypothetical protein